MCVYTDTQTQNTDSLNNLIAKCDNFNYGKICEKEKQWMAASDGNTTKAPVHQRMNEKRKKNQKQNGKKL